MYFRYMRFNSLFVIFIIFFTSGCSSTLKTSYAKLSKAEKTWVIFHSFKAKKAYEISHEAESVKDSISNVGSIVNDNNGGQLDAFKHAFWMARLTQGIGIRAARSLGKAHEKGNYQSFKKRQLEDGFLPDKPSTDMDLDNNDVGISIGERFNKESKNKLIEIVIDSVRKGKMKILLKDEKGYFLDCAQKRIPLDSLKGKWNTKKCLVPSNHL